MGCWSVEATDVFAPDLWACEVTSALRKAVSITGMPSREAEAHLETVMRLGVQWTADRRLADLAGTEVRRAARIRGLRLH